MSVIKCLGLTRSLCSLRLIDLLIWIDFENYFENVVKSQKKINKKITIVFWQGNSYVLLLRVSAPGNCDSEPFSKRRRLSELSSSVSATNSAEAARLLDAELIVYDRHSRCLLIDGDYELVLQETNQSLVENRNSSALNNGTVEKSPRKGTASWSTLEPSANIPTTLLDQGPTLKFRLQWSNDPITGLVDRYVS